MLWASKTKSKRSDNFWNRGELGSNTVNLGLADKTKLVNNGLAVRWTILNDIILLILRVFSQSVRYNLASPQAPLLSKNNFHENQYCCTSMRDLIKDTPLIDRAIDPEREREAQHQAGFDPPDISVKKRVLYRCATTAAQVQTKLKICSTFWSISYECKSFLVHYSLLDNRQYQRARSIIFLETINLLKIVILEIKRSIFKKRYRYQYRY